MLSIRKRIKLLITTIVVMLLIITFSITLITMIFPIGYSNIIIKYAEEYNIDPYLVAAIINVESKYDKNAVSNKEAKGLMQIAPQTGKWGAETLEIENYNEKLLFEPDTNIKIGTWYLNRLLKEFNKDIDLVLAAYNAGSGNVSKWLKDKRYCEDGYTLTNIPFKETDEYLDKVHMNYKVYKLIYKNVLAKSDGFNISYINFIGNIRRRIKGIVDN